jgi:hypothetical protein
VTVDCLVCHTPTHDFFLCASCWNELAVNLADLAGYQRNANGQRMIPMAVELDVVLSRQDRLGKVMVQVTGTTERPLPVNLHAGLVRDRLAAVLAAWVAYLSRGSADPHASMITDAQWLLWRPHEVRGLHNADELFAQITDAIDAARRVIDNRAVRIFVGECGAEPEDGGTCLAPLWADSSYAMTRCHACDTSWPSMERWESYRARVKDDRLADVVDKRLGARRMATVLTALGHPVSEGAVRKWARLGRIEQSGVDDRGRKAYRAGDVLDLLAEASAAA